MKATFCCLLTLVLIGSACSSSRPMQGHRVQLFDGKTFKGWEGDTNTIWRIEKNSLVGGSLQRKVPHNEFICTTKAYSNFVLHVRFRLLGTNGFVNGGVQVRSKHIKNPPYELSGYQADMGDPGWWGCLYDESRRDRVLAKSNMAEVNKVLKRQDWNDYLIRCEGDSIQIWLNGYPTASYIEKDSVTEKNEPIPRFGIIGLQIHGGGAAEAWYKDIYLEELP